MARPKKVENTEMTAIVETPVSQESGNENAAVKTLRITEIKQPITLLNLETGEDEKLICVYNTYTVNEKANPQDVANALSEIVSPLTEQNKALAAYAQAQSYQAGKVRATSAGQYLTPAMRTKIVDFLKMTGKFEDMKSSEVFDRWLVGYKAGKEGAKKILARLTENDELVADL